ncbi:hypothetical protein [Hyperthermus butylicus]|uniref:Uncharacterized protein n=1 Tax=Hyperthermus butylicus (strain DSM 5456 / JCM 9403 / PLM1-5) TaxID=415426 RepID=A2BJK5_HYPBU|nr:hypothetical protein [Hyperthermus butylicus]ABM80166.1 hypothetical protein Hbut_0294 [Hyperthermus butylicus DSM 5456]
MQRLERAIAAIGRGIVTGVAYYTVFVLVLHRILATMAPSIEPITENIHTYLAAVILLAVLSTAETALQDVYIVAPLKILSKLLAALIFADIVNYGNVEAVIQGVRVYINISPIVYTMILLSLAYGALDAASYTKARAEERLKKPQTQT